MQAREERTGVDRQSGPADRRMAWSLRGREATEQSPPAAPTKQLLFLRHLVTWVWVRLLRRPSGLAMTAAFRRARVAPSAGAIRSPAVGLPQDRRSASLPRRGRRAAESALPARLPLFQHRRKLNASRSTTQTLHRAAGPSTPSAGRGPRAARRGDATVRPPGRRGSVDPVLGDARSLDRVRA